MVGITISQRPLARAVFLCYNISMRIYISGAMAKRPDTYKKEFAKAEKEITDKGYTVINPAWLPKGLDRNRYMPICMAMVDAADAIYMMNGWEDSKGAACGAFNVVTLEKRNLYKELWHQTKEKKDEKPLPGQIEMEV